MQSVEAKKPGDILCDVDAEALDETLAFPVVTMAPRLAEMTGQTAAKTLIDVVFQALVET